MKEKKILLIEDDPDHAFLIIDIFEIEDINKEVILIKDGQEAIDYFQKKDIYNDEKLSQIDLILLDLSLPKVSGMDVLKFIKESPKYCLIPVFILSSSCDTETVKEVYKSGASGFIAKPISYEDLVQKIRTQIVYNKDENQKLTVS